MIFSVTTVKQEALDKLKRDVISYGIGSIFSSLVLVSTMNKEGDNFGNSLLLGTSLIFFWNFFFTGIARIS